MVTDIGLIVEEGNPHVNCVLDRIMNLENDRHVKSVKACSSTLCRREAHAGRK